MMKAVSVCGYHHTGKTTVCEVIIRGLKKRGYSVSSIKNIHADTFAIEKSGSNSDRHSIAGAEPVFARGNAETGLIWQRQLDIHEMKSHLSADWLVVEGMSKLAVPRIICAQNERELEELVDDTAIAISGKIADDLQQYRQLPVISAITSPDDLLDLVIEKCFSILPQADPVCCSKCGISCREFVGRVLAGERKRCECVAENLGTIRIYINDQEMKLVPFVQNIIHDTLEALLRNLKGYQKGRIRLEFDNSNEDK
jgi:molybdopterin-guanine dinucleotide biosynthesis adapter protein